MTPDAPLKLAPNKVDYLIPGGEMINEFLGEAPGAAASSQLWVASLVTSALRPGTTVGLSRIAGTDRFLRDCLAEDPAAWLGSEHVRRWGLSLGFLLKLLHSRDRLLIQTHPDGEKAMKYFGQPRGKDEAWYVLAARPGACIWLGFRPGAAPERFRALIEAQDAPGMLDCLHKIELRPGQVYVIPAGTVHALGSDCLVAEIQEPVDLTLRTEYIRPDGSVLPRESMYGPAGMEGLMDCLTFDCLSREALLAKHRFSARPRPAQPWRRTLIGPEQTRRFTLEELVLGPDCQTGRVEDPGFQVLLALEGTAELRWQGGTLPVRQGEELFLPYRLPAWELSAAGRFRALLCGPGGD